MQLKILIPSGVFASIAEVAKIVVMTPAGSFGLLPHRRDCATVLVPGLLTYTLASGEVHIAVDAGVLVKSGANVLACVRHAVADADLGQLHQAVAKELNQLDDQEKLSRTTLAHLESGLIRAFVELQRV